MDRLQQQKRLRERVAAGEVRYVFLDPDGTAEDRMAVIIQWPTGVVYGQQCAGTSTDLRLAEGYYVPVGGVQFGPGTSPLSAESFRAIFHMGNGCRYDWGGAALPAERLAQLRELLREVPYWQTGLDDDKRGHLELDDHRLDELCEAWVPVTTPDGPGMLLFGNCD